MTPVTEVILAKAVRTCIACPSQWDAWDLDGNYWYLRYRNGYGTAERQPGPGWECWDDKQPEIAFKFGHPHAGSMSLAEFCRLSGLNLHPQADVTGEYDAA